MNTLPRRSATTKAVVASSGSSRSARAASARVAAAIASALTGCASGTEKGMPLGPDRLRKRHEDVNALGPARLARARQPRLGQRLPHEARRPCDDVEAGTRGG